MKSKKQHQQTNEGFVYIIKDENSRIKVGASKHPEKRFSDIRAMAGLEIVQVYITPPTANYKQVCESTLDYFKIYKHYGDWLHTGSFKAVKEYVDSALKLIKAVERPSLPALPALQTVQADIQETQKEFLTKFKKTIDRTSIDDARLWFSLLGEEYGEVAGELTVKNYKDINWKNLTAELADLLYVTLGFANAMELPVLSFFKEIHKANMRKVDAEGNPIFRDDGKVLKPEGWQPADLEGLWQAFEHIRLIKGKNGCNC